MELVIPEVKIRIRKKQKRKRKKSRGREERGYGRLYGRLCPGVY